ncbi:hypothetical protein FA13DRAFT_1014312 [Coprinellus micaceus]|uniref:Uncharacterized protein n=1 Tax=Coprinellus micaceus TaxID=71717 RepID=A0A4Y7RP48_COPMI|nr:hypothetical protein FA13DRAFT_1014312 [Coprinellus micaceus]
MPTQSVTELADGRQSRSAVIVTLGLALRLLPRYSYYVNGWYLSSWSLKAEVVAQRHLDRGLIRARNFATSWQRFVQAQSAAQNSGIRCWPKRRRLLTIQPTLRAASRPKFCARPSSLFPRLPNTSQCSGHQEIDCRGCAYCGFADNGGWSHWMLVLVSFGPPYSLERRHPRKRCWNTREVPCTSVPIRFPSTRGAGAPKARVASVWHPLGKSAHR